METAKINLSFLIIFSCFVFMFSCGSNDKKVNPQDDPVIVTDSQLTDDSLYETQIDSNNQQDTEIVQDSNPETHIEETVDNIEETQQDTIVDSEQDSVVVPPEDTQEEIVEDENEETADDIEETQQDSVVVDPTTSRLENITKPCAPGVMPAPVLNGTDAYASRYWDCCKPHCSWPENTDDLAANCNVNNEEIECYNMVGNEWWQGPEGTRNGCDQDGVAFTCYNHAPFAVCENLAYGFAAVPPPQDENDMVCGKCYQLDFDGGVGGDASVGGIKEAHTLVEGKTMIVMASNIGHDVSSGQFDIMIPGGGLGAFPAGCATQWNVDPDDRELVGEKFGGFTLYCQQTNNMWDAPADDIKDCVRGMCENLFGQDESMRYLYEGCIWYVEWMHAVDNPSVVYKEVECPQVLRDLYGSSFH